MRHHFKPTRMARLKKSGNTAGENVGKLEALLVGGRWGALWKAMGRPRVLTHGRLAQTHGHGHPQDVHMDVRSQQQCPLHPGGTAPADSGGENAAVGTVSPFTRFAEAAVGQARAGKREEKSRGRRDGRRAACSRG